MPAILEDEMTRRDTMPVRLGNEAIEAAKIAASLRGMTLTDYATTVLLEAANHDIDVFARARVKGSAAGEPKPKRPRKTGQDDPR